MKVLVTGCSGLLGAHVCQVLNQKGHQVVGFMHDQPPPPHVHSSRSVDLFDETHLGGCLSTERPDAIINCVGLVNVDKCEQNPLIAYDINARVVGLLAKYSLLLGARFIHISTDHLFDGTIPFRTETAIPSPLNVYGRSKWMGERICVAENPKALIVRTNFYGWPLCPRPNMPPTFAEWLYTSFRDGKPIQLFDDYFFNALEVTHLAETIEALLHVQFDGILNVVSPEKVSKCGFGLAMAGIFGFDTKNVTVASSVQMKIPRPKDMSLSTLRLEILLGRRENLIEGLTRLYNTKKKEK